MRALSSWVWSRMRRSSSDRADSSLCQSQPLLGLFLAHRLRGVACRRCARAPAARSSLIALIEIGHDHRIAGSSPRVSTFSRMPASAADLTVDQEQPALDRQPRLDPGQQVAAIGVAGIDLELPDLGFDLDLIAHDLDLRSRRPAAGGRACPAPGSRSAAPSFCGRHRWLLQVMADAPGIAHAAGGDDDGAAGDAVQRLALLHRLDGSARWARGTASPPAGSMSSSACRCRSNTSVARIASGESR